MARKHLGIGPCHTHVCGTDVSRSATLIFNEQIRYQRVANNARINY